MHEAHDDSGFAAIADGGFIDVLRRLRLSLAVTTDPNRLALISAADGELELSSTKLSRCRGLSVAGGRMAVVTAREIVIFSNVGRLAAHHPDRRDHFDAFFYPRMTIFTGYCMIHDIILDGSSVIAANTRFSTISRFDGRFTFTPLWQPPFITEVVPEDRCHLNGIAVMADEVRYATAMAPSNTASGWQHGGPDQGVLMDTRTGAILCKDLCMPHSPRVISGRLLVLDTGSGRLIEVDPATGERRTVVQLPGFTCGLSAYGGVAFVGLSTQRGDSLWSFAIVESGMRLQNGIAAIDLADGTILGLLEFTGGVAEVIDVQPLPGILRPGIHDMTRRGARSAIDLADTGFWMAPINRSEGSEA